MVVLAVLFYLGILNPKSMAPTQCTFPAGFTCITWQLYTNGQLYLKIGQGIGKTINITGFRCTTNASFVPGQRLNFSFGGSGAPGPISGEIMVPSASQAELSSPRVAAINFTCMKDDSNSPATGSIGDTYNGKLYINYTELDTSIQRVTIGSISAKYEVGGAPATSPCGNGVCSGGENCENCLADCPCSLPKQCCPGGLCVTPPASCP
jgi:hypothetical protein